MVARCRTALSAWTATYWTKLVTPNAALAVSNTRQTTTAAISTGLPSESETFSRAVSKLPTRNETDRLVENGTVQWKPAVLTVPTYRPKNWTTRASFGLSTKNPVTSTRNRIVPTIATVAAAGKIGRASCRETA